MKKTFIPALVACLCLAGCEAPKTPGGGNSGRPETKFTAGRVDTGVILQTNPEYMKMSQEYFREQNDLRIEVNKKLQTIGSNHEAQAAYRTEIQKRQKTMNEHWMKRTQEFIDSNHARMRDAVEEICKEKGIDLVVIDSKVYPTTEYGALDITQEVLNKLGTGVTNPTANPTASPTPESSPQ